MAADSVWLAEASWQARLRFKTHDSSFEIRTTNPRVLDALPAYLPPGWTHLDAEHVDVTYSLLLAGPEMPDADHMLYVDEELVHRTRELEELRLELIKFLHWHTALGARRTLFVHAGAVGWNGRAIVLPGNGFSGKSTLVAALMRAGAEYYSDNYAVFDIKGRLHPYPKHISMRTPEGEFGGAYLVEELGGRVGSTALPVGLVAFLQFRPGAGWQPRALTPAQGVIELMNHTMQARLNPQRTLATLANAVACAVILAGDRGEADEVAAQLVQSL